MEIENLIIELGSEHERLIALGGKTRALGNEFFVPLTGFPSSRGGELRCTSRVPGQFERLTHFPFHFDHVYQVPASGHQSPGDSAEPALYPRPSVRCRECFTLCVVAWLILPIDARCVVGQCGAIPEQVRRHVGAGAGVRQPMDAVGMHREVETVGVTMTSAGSSALETGVTIS